MNNKQLLKATAAAMLADALAGYVSTERLANYLARHGWQRRPEEEAAHKYVEMVFTAPVTADDGSAIYLVIYQEKTDDWLGKPLRIMSALELVAAVEERSKLAVLLEWLNPAHAEAVRQLLIALDSEPG